MGNHWFSFAYDKDYDCNEIFPVQLVYHNGVLNAFVWQHFATLEGNRWEHPPKLALDQIINTAPTCLYDALESPGLSTMHIYVREHLLLC